MGELVRIPLSNFNPISREKNSPLGFSSPHCLSALPVKLKRLDFEIYESQTIDFATSLGLQQIPWWLEFNEFDGWRWKLRLLIVAFKLAIDHPITYKSFIYPERNNELNRCDQYIRSIRTPDDDGKPVFEEDFKRIEEVYLRMEIILSSKQKEYRPQNSIYFLQQGLMQPKWTGAWLNWSCALECIFGSKDSKGKVSEEVSQRIANYLLLDCKDILKLYDIRSKIIHGQLHRIAKEPPENLNKLSKFWQVVRSCFVKVLEYRDYERLTKKRHGEFLSDLNKGNIKKTDVPCL